MSEIIVFVYHKEGKLKVLSLEDAGKNNERLLAEKWRHVATMNPCVFIEHLFTLEDVDIIADIRELGIKQV